MKANLLNFLMVALLTVSASAATQGAGTENVQPTPAAPPVNETPMPPSAATPRLNGDLGKKIEALNRAPSNGISEIVKMMEQGVEPSVVRSYVENSTTPYSATANDILYLHQHAVPSEIITAVIRRGAEVRAQLAKAYQENQNQIATSSTASKAAVSPVAVSTGSPVVQPAYSYYYSAPQPVYVPVTYPVYSYSYTLPSYSLYSYYAYRPSYCSYPVRYFSGCGPYRAGFSVGYRNHSPRFSVGASFGHLRHGARFTARVR